MRGFANVGPSVMAMTARRSSCREVELRSERGERMADSRPRNASLLWGKNVRSVVSPLQPRSERESIKANVFAG